MQKVFKNIIEKLEHLHNNFGEHCEEWGENKEGDCHHKSCSDCVLNHAIEIVKQAAANYNNGWIPISSEQLPKENEFYNVTIFDGEDYRTEPAYYARIGFWGQKNIMPNWWTDCTSNAELIEEDDDEVVAWQPLPESYHPNGYTKKMDEETKDKGEIK